VPATLDAVLLERWAEAAVAVLERHGGEIDRINVFPVADRDTGTNLLLTMRAAVAERPGVPVGPGGGPGAAPGVVATAEALARGALRGARGNSGVILSQVLRGVAEAVAAGRDPRGGGVLADALGRAARLAADAVSSPRAGTVLTVLAAAAAAARDTVRDPAVGDRLDAVAVAAATAAGRALRATTAQLPELARAGVVDAGGLGLHLVLDALAVLLTGRAAAGPPTGLPRPAVSPAPVAEPGDGGSGSPPVERSYEVMYLLDGSDDTRARALRAVLDTLGTAVAVVGDGAPGGAGTWTVHAHCTDIGAVLEAGMRAGRPHGVRVAPLVERPDHVSAGADRDTGHRASGRVLVALVRGAEVARLAREAGAHVLVCEPEPDAGVPDGARGAADDIDAAALDRVLGGAALVVLLPCDASLVPPAERAAAAVRRTGRAIVVVPAASAVAGLAALAVHDPVRHATDDVVAMTEAAAGTRTGVLQVAESEALTWAGRCRPGDVLGLVDGEVVLIAPDVSVGALWLASRMVTAGGELVTALLGAEVADALGEELAAELHRRHPEVDVVVHRGARPGVLMELGVE
jgi:DAK2 domain fusion protein YloV